ncbi:MAG: PAAR domain-containing protein [Deltaproteobacteria bacterium]|nr:PAAR domain-containing protein [Deltaproteobacteria bacterium]
MPPAARLGDDHLCPAAEGPKPHKGGPIAPPCEVTVLIGNQPAARVGDPAICVGPPDAIQDGSPTVLIGNQPAARVGDATVHGGKIILGEFSVLIGSSGQAEALRAAARAGAPFCQL